MLSMTSRTWIIALLLTVGLPGLCESISRAQEPLFSGAFADGVFMSGGKITEWHAAESKAEPKFNGRPLFDQNKPIRWLRRDSAEQIAAPTAYVEMVGGDRLPGRVLDYYPSGTSQADRQPPHLVVKPDVPVDLPEQAMRQRLRVAVHYLRKIVWQRRSSDAYMPGTLFYADGRQLTFERLNWTSGGVTLLLKDGTRKVSFGEMAELHLPRRSPWETYFDTLAVLSPDCASRLVRLETFAGLAATTSLARLHPRAVSGDPSGWYHGIQPAWSLDLLWVRHTHVAMRRFFLPHEVALSMIEPLRIVQRASLGGGWNLQVDRNVKSLPLTAAQKSFGWGFGVAAYSELEFELPALVKSFRTQIALDDVVGSGGCVKTAVFANKPEGQPLYQGKQLVGSSEVIDSGAIALTGPDQGQKSLLLVVDPSHTDRPAGSDPLDVRDLVDWLEPLVELDADKLKLEVAKRVPRTVPAFDGWQIVLTDGSKLAIQSRWDNYLSADCRFRLESITNGGSLTLSRKVQLTPEQKYLLVSVDRFVEGTGTSDVEVHVDGQLYARFAVPERRTGVAVDPLLVPLDAWAGKVVNLEVIHRPTDGRSLIDWRALELVEYTSDTPWTPLAIREMKSAGGASLCMQPDGSIYVCGKPVEHDTFTLVADTQLQGITAIRLEALTDPRLHGNGPGRAGGQFGLTNFGLTAEPRDKSQPAATVAFERAEADHSPQDGPIAATIDNSPHSGWGIWPQQGQPHVAVFTCKEEFGFPEGTRLTFTLDHRLHAHHSIGRFRLSATNVPRPVPVERPGVIVPVADRVPLVIFDDDPAFINTLIYGNGNSVIETADRKFGAASVRVNGDNRFADNPPNMPIKIREKPGPGEYRFLRFAWKKPEGKIVGLNLCHDGAWNAVGDKKFSYQAGPGAFSTSLAIDANLPKEWTVVTRDLFADFGEFTLTGIGLAPVDGPYALFDNIVLARRAEDFDAAK
jgi:hypothetical protein